MSKFISHFSPQRSNPEDLERIFVGREALLAESVEKIRDSALTDNKHHLLFVASRGAGKTNLATLIHHRLNKQEDLAEKLRFAWLNEDETSSTFLKLLIRIYRALANRYPSEFTLRISKDIVGKEANEALDTLKDAFLSHLGTRTCVAIIENTDALFSAMPEKEIRRWRAFLQDYPRIATIATSQNLFEGVSKRDNPFFGFFDITHLQALTHDQARDLLKKILTNNGKQKDKQAIIELLDSPKGQARLKAIHYLTGGNPRLYLILADFISLDSFDTLISAFEQMVDKQLTPYYQERLRWLSQQQREIVEFLCQNETRIVPVKTIAEALFAEHSSIASQLKKLRESGYVSSHPRGREVYYELAEPLMRLTFQVKDSTLIDSGPQPLRLFVDLLRTWFERTEIETNLKNLDPNSLGTRYYAAALASKEDSYRNSILPEIDHLLTDIDPFTCTDEEFEELKRAAENSPTIEILSAYALSCMFRGQWQNVVEAIDRMLQDPSIPVKRKAWALVRRGFAYEEIDRIGEAIEDYSEAIDMKDAPKEQTALALFGHGVALGKVGRPEDSIKNFTKVITMQDAPPNLVLQALVNRGIALRGIGRIEEAIEDYSNIIAVKDASPEQVVRALVDRGFAYKEIGRNTEAIEDYSKAITNKEAPSEQVVWALIGRGFVRRKIDKTEEAIEDCFDALFQLTLSDSTELASKLTEVIITLAVRYVYALSASLKTIEYASRLTKHCTEIDRLSKLGSSIIGQLSMIKSDNVSKDGLILWAAIWTKAGEGHASLEIPIRLLNTGAEYLKSNDKGLLLQLPKEERELLIEILGKEE